MERLLRTGSSPLASAHSVCGEAVLKGADIYVRGVRAASAGLQAGDAVSVYADVRGTLLRGSVPEALDEAMRFLGTGTCCVSRPELFRLGSGKGVAIPYRGGTGGVATSTSGWASRQESPVLILEPSGQPTHLVTAVNVGDGQCSRPNCADHGDRSYALVQPLRMG